MHGMNRIAVVCAVTMLAAGCNAKSDLRGKKPPEQGPSEKVHLIWKQADNKWKVKLNGGPELDPDKARSEIKKDKGPRVFEVDIQGPSNMTFLTSGALTVWEGAGPGGAKAPPPSAPGTNPTQIVGPSVATDGRTLVFVDLNYGDPVTLNYALHFKQPTDPSAPKIPSVDPIIDNGGGEWQ